MVMCSMDNVPRPPALPPGGRLEAVPETASLRGSPGFRLLDDQDTGSVYSVYKQKIDAMFESDSSSNTKNSVQAKIERMFTEVAIDNGIPVNEIGCHVFSVDYLGSVALQEKVTSLAGLQQPLRELYLEYKRSCKRDPMSGRLEISANGLKVQNGDLEQLNSFPTIAVWSAVKFVLHEETYAFLPLITDPDNMDKQALFRALDDEEKNYINDDHHSPLFAVVMRKHKRLECHGFVCQTSEDAIVIAATLYKSLMAHVKANERKPKNQNGITCMSIASSTLNGKEDSSIPVRPPRKKRSTTSSVSSERDGLEVSDTQPLINKSPKKSIKNKRAPKAPELKQDLDAIVPYEEHSQEEAKPKPSMLGDKWNTLMSNHQKQITAEIKQKISEGSSVALRRVQSIRKRELSKSESTGDILTKVTIPRSGSFLNAGGLTRYKSKVYKENGQASNGSPLGFHELFNEFRLQEGLHSVDEILGVIIDPEGMSFNDLKPIYKEFLLKLALTLTKDELFQRSKAIMRRQKKKMLKAKKKRKRTMSVKFKKLRSIFTKPLKGKLKNLQEVECVKTEEDKLQEDAKPPESSISTSSYDTRQFQPKDAAPVTRKQSYRRRSSESKLSASRRQRERTSTSEESDFFSVRKPKSKQLQQQPHHYPNRNSSSGYVSCSECSYDSDTCTCVSADKCYCSLGGNKNFSRRNKTSPNSSAGKCSCGTDNTTVYCGCDTDSCTDSNKCYCQKGTIFQQLKQRGFIPSAESTITPPQHRKLCKKYSNTKSTKSLEYMHNPSELYYEKLKNRPRSLVENERGSIIVDKRRRSCDVPLDYELYSIKNGSVRQVNSGVVYGRVVNDRGLLDVQKPASVRSRHSGYGRSRSTTITSSGCNEALSVKKSAEIAALFADIKLSQTTDITHIMPPSYFDGSFVTNNLVPAKAYSRVAKQGEGVNYQRIMQNSMYGSKRKNHLYSTTNGLYTIQSQSDESRRSSLSALNKKKEDEDYFAMDKNVSSSLENSLGYLP